MSETKESSTQTITTTLHHINNNNSNNIEINIICKKCLKEINYKQIISHDSRCHTELNTCSKCNLKIDINRLERHKLKKLFQILRIVMKFQYMSLNVQNVEKYMKLMIYAIFTYEAIIFLT